MEEPKPKRGEIWRVRLSPRRGSEMRGEHPCLIISVYETNERFPIATILPITTYSPYKEEMRSLWYITFQCADGSARKSDVDIHPRNDEYEPPNERLRRVTSENRPYKSTIDCAQIWTVSKKYPPEDTKNYELRWDRPHGALREEKMVQVDTALQMLLSGDILYRGQLQYRQGNVLRIYISGAPSERFLVVSSSGIDAVREQPIRFDKKSGTYKRYGHCTVVPLVSAGLAQHFPNEVLVDIHPIGKTGNPITELAICSQLYTIEWRSREIERGPVGRVLDRNVDDVLERDMVDVRVALRYCLGLPQ